MVGTVVPGTCWACKKYNKIISGIQLVFILHLSQWCTVQHINFISLAAIQSKSHNFPHPGRIACCSTSNSRKPANKALHTICGNNTSIVSSCWWWAYECSKHVEKIISAIKHSVASNWFSSLRLYYEARTNMLHICQNGCALPRCFYERVNTRKILTLLSLRQS